MDRENLEEKRVLSLQKPSSQTTEDGYSSSSQDSAPLVELEELLNELEEIDTPKFRENYFSSITSYANDGRQIIRAEGALIKFLKITTGIDLSSYSLSMEFKAVLDFGLQVISKTESITTGITVNMLNSATYYIAGKSMEYIDNFNIPIPCPQIGLGAIIGLTSASKGGVIHISSKALLSPAAVMGAMNGLDVCLKKYEITSQETIFHKVLRYTVDGAAAFASSVIDSATERSPLTKFLYLVSAVSLTDTAMQNLYAINLYIENSISAESESVCPSGSCGNHLSSAILF